MTPRYVDADAEVEVNRPYFLVEADHTGYGGVTTRWQLRDQPLRTNQSHQPRLVGWCGETDNVSRHARGMVRVTSIAGNGRARIVRLQGAELTAALEQAGYPELDPATDGGGK